MATRTMHLGVIPEPARFKIQVTPETRGRMTPSPGERRTVHQGRRPSSDGNIHRPGDLAASSRTRRRRTERVIIVVSDTEGAQGRRPVSRLQDVCLVSVGTEKSTRNRTYVPHNSGQARPMAVSVPNTRTWHLTRAFRRLWHPATTVLRATRDLGVSPDRTHTSWPTTACRSVTSASPLGSTTPELLDALAVQCAVASGCR